MYMLQGTCLSQSFPQPGGMTQMLNVLIVENGNVAVFSTSNHLLTYSLVGW